MNIDIDMWKWKCIRHVYMTSSTCLIAVDYVLLYGVYNNQNL